MRGRGGEKEDERTSGGGEQEEERMRRGEGEEEGKDGATKDFLLLGNKRLSRGAHVRRGPLPYFPARP